MQRLSCERGKKLDAGANGFRLQRIAKRKTQTESCQLDRARLQINSVNLLEQRFKDRNVGTFPIILDCASAAPAVCRPQQGRHPSHMRGRE